jgi:hypothetical protein
VREREIVVFFFKVEEQATFVPADPLLTSSTGNMFPGTKTGSSTDLC